MKSWLYPNIFKSYPELVAVQSSRHGGVSEGPLGSLNLGNHTSDKAERIQANQVRFVESLGFTLDQVASSYQVHQDKVLVVHQPGHWGGYDALISNQKGLLLTITVADCTPILIFDPIRKSIAAIHAGWKGTSLSIVEKTIREMIISFNCDPKTCSAWIGACIGKDDYEVDEDVADYFNSPYKSWDRKRDKYLLDLKKANQDQLLKMGLSNDAIEICPISTAAQSDHYFSHRASKGKAGRAWAAIGIQDKTFPKTTTI